MPVMCIVPLGGIGVDRTKSAPSKSSLSGGSRQRINAYGTQKYLTWEEIESSKRKANRAALIWANQGRALLTGDSKGRAGKSGNKLGGGICNSLGQGLV